MCFGITDHTGDQTVDQIGDQTLNRRQLLAGLANSTILAGTLGGTLVGTAGCISTNAASGRSGFTGLQSIDDDIAQGRANHPKILKSFGGAYEDNRLSGYIQSIGLRLATQTEYQQYPYRFTILNTQIVNAFALPGGFIYITRGLLSLASSEAELAGVLSHELAHVTARHGAERQTAQQAAQTGLLLGAIGLQVSGLPSDLLQVGQSVAQTAIGAAIKGYSREHEFEADTLGIRYMSQAGYDADAMRDRRLQTVKTVVKRQERMTPKGHDDRFLLKRQYRRFRILRPCR